MVRDLTSSRLVTHSISITNEWWTIHSTTKVHIPLHLILLDLHLPTSTSTPGPLGQPPVYAPSESQECTPL